MAVRYDIVGTELDFSIVVHNFRADMISTSKVVLFSFTQNA